MVVTLALILTFSPGEKEQRSHLSGFADNRPANPVAGFRVRRQVVGRCDAPCQPPPNRIFSKHERTGNLDRRNQAPTRAGGA